MCLFCSDPQAKLETKALKAKRPGFTDERYHETSYYIENGKCTPPPRKPNSINPPVLMLVLPATPDGRYFVSLFGSYTLALHLTGIESNVCACNKEPVTTMPPTITCYTLHSNSRLGTDGTKQINHAAVVCTVQSVCVRSPAFGPPHWFGSALPYYGHPLRLPPPVPSRA